MRFVRSKVETYRISKETPRLTFHIDIGSRFENDAVQAALLVSKERDLAAANSTLLAVVRASYSMPPDHGAAVVRTILENPELKEDWLAELAEVRDRINANRAAAA